MTLTNYWWLLLWMFTGAAFLAVFVPRREEIVFGRKEVRWTPFAAVMAVLPYIIWASTRRWVGDTESYRSTFLKAPMQLSELPEYISGISKDKGFYSLMVVIKSIVGDHPEIYFFILATIQIISIVIVFRKYSCDYWFSIFVFIASTDYISWVFNGARQFTAVTLIYAATTLILKQKYIPAVFIVLIASTLHGSALLMIPIIFIIQGKALNKKTILCIIVSLTALVFVEQFTNVLDMLLADTQYTNVVSDWKEWQDDGINPIRVLVYAMPTILSLIGLKQIREVDDPVINMTANASVISTAFGIIAMGTSGIFIGRLPIYVSLYATGVLLPWEIKNLFTEDSARLVKIVAVVCYIAFFYYQLHVIWGWL